MCTCSTCSSLFFFVLSGQRFVFNIQITEFFIMIKEKLQNSETLKQRRCSSNELKMRSDVPKKHLIKRIILLKDNQTFLSSFIVLRDSEVLKRDSVLLNFKT